MNKKMKIMQGIGLSLLLILTSVVIYFYVKMLPNGDDEANGAMNETGLGLFLLLVIGSCLIVYTLVYIFFYIRLWQGKQATKFHEINLKVVGVTGLVLILLILSFRKIFLIIYLGPLVLPFAFLYFTSKQYVKLAQSN